MKRKRITGPVVRAMAVITAVGVISAGITFAALQSQGSALTGNSIESATAALQISRTGTTYADSQPGFDFAGIVPGGTAMPAGGYTITLKNTGTAPLGIFVSIPVAPQVTGTVDLTKVFLQLTKVNGATYGQPVALSLASLMNATSGTGQSIGTNIVSGVGQTFLVQVSMAADAVTGNSVSIQNLDLVFTGALAN